MIDFAAQLPCYDAAKSFTHEGRLKVTGKADFIVNNNLFFHLSSPGSPNLISTAACVCPGNHASLLSGPLYRRAWQKDGSHNRGRFQAACPEPSGQRLWPCGLQAAAWLLSCQSFCFIEEFSERRHAVDNTPFQSFPGVDGGPCEHDLPSHGLCRLCGSSVAWCALYQDNTAHLLLTRLRKPCP